MTAGVRLPPGLPGVELIEQGLADLAAGNLSTREALLVTMASQRLRALGLEVPTTPTGEPEIELYRVLGESLDDPFFEYRALRSRLDSFVSSLELWRKEPS